MPQRVYAAHFGHAATFIFYNSPDRKVFADGRLEVNRQAALQEYLDIQIHLIQQDTQAESLLSQGDPTNLPALLLDVEHYAPFAAQILGHPRWRPVFCDSIAIVLLPEPFAEQAGIPALDRRALLPYLQLVAQTGSVRRTMMLRDELGR